jgi:hypothetical protein
VSRSGRFTRVRLVLRVWSNDNHDHNEHNEHNDDNEHDDHHHDDDHNHDHHATADSARECGPGLHHSAERHSADQP